MRRFVIVFLFIPFLFLGQQTRKIDSLYSFIKQSTEINDKVDSYISLFDYCLQFAPEKTAHYIEELKTLENGRCERCIAVAYLFEGHLARDRGKVQQALQKYTIAIEKAEIAKDTITLNKGIAWTSSTYLDLNDYDSARKYTQRLINKTPKGKVNRGLLDAYFMLGIINNEQGYFNTAIESYIIADSLTHELDELTYLYPGGINNNLAKLFREIKDFEKAEAYMTKAKNIFIEAKDSSQITLVDQHFGILQTDKGNYTAAIEILNTTLTHYTKVNLVYKIAEANLYLGLSKNGLKQYTSAVNSLEKSISIYQQIGDSLSLAESYNFIGDSYLGLKNYPEAQLNLNKALTIANKIEIPPVQIRVVQSLSDLAQETGDFEKAFYYEKSKDSLNTIFQKTLFANRTYDLESKFQSEQKQQQIDLLTSQRKLLEERSKNERNLLFAGLVLLALTGLFFYIQYRNRKKINDKLRELDTAKSTFFANISHEFRTPLTLIKGPVEDQLAKKELDQNSRKNLLTAQRNVIRLENLVEQLLALSKLESGHFNLQVEPGNLPRFIAAQAEAFSFSCHEKSIDYQIKLPDDENTDWFDHDALEKILFNLIGNAIKFTPENGTIGIYGFRENERFKILVRNTGNIIKREHQKNLFEHFYKIDSKSTGTGIGLALTKELTELHQGTIQFENHTDGFLEFSIEIPVSKTVFKPSEVFSEASRSFPGMTTFSSEEIKENSTSSPEDAPIMLIVDDARDIRNYVTSIFETTYNVHTAKNGKEGFEIALELIPDIIISDVMMPEEDGFMLTKHIKQHELTSHIPIVLLTAKSEITDKLEAMEIGADSYMTKPFSSQLVKATADNLIESRRKLQQRFSQEVILIPKDIAVSSADEQFLKRMQTVLDDKLTDSNFTVEEFGKEMSVSRMQLHRKLKALTGQSTSEFLRSQRLRLALNLIKEGKISISEIGYTVGFNDPSYFTKCFKQEYGHPPSEYKSK